MSKVCHETGIPVNVNYQSMSALVRDPATGRVAYSNLEVALCSEAFARVRASVVSSPDQLNGNIGYAFETHTGVRGGFSGNVQMSLGSTGHADFKYVEREFAERQLPNSSVDLMRNPEWMEKREDGAWQKADWAFGLYASDEQKN